MATKFVPNVEGPPQTAVNVGCEVNGCEWMYTVLVQHPQYGPVGGKATKLDAWYTHDGREYQTGTFSWLTVTKGRTILLRNRESLPVPKGRIDFGKEIGQEHHYFAALAITEYGLMPGKAMADRCWYGHNGHEYSTSNFMWLICEDQ